MKETINIFHYIQHRIPNAEITMHMEESSLFITIKKCIDHNPHGSLVDLRPWGLNYKISAAEIQEMEKTGWGKNVDEFCKLFKAEFTRHKKFIKDNSEKQK